MTATRSGPVVGQAITPFNGTGTGTVLALVKNTYYMGSLDEAFAENIDFSSGTGALFKNNAYVTNRLGIGTTNPTANLDTSGTIRFSDLTSGNLMSDASGNLYVTSDIRLKTVEGDFTRGLADVMGLTPIVYKWNELSGLETRGSYAGFSAQNVQAFIPEAVSENSNGFLNLQDRPILAALVNASKELAARVSALENMHGITPVPAEVTQLKASSDEASTNIEPLANNSSPLNDQAETTSSVLPTSEPDSSPKTTERVQDETTSTSGIIVSLNPQGETVPAEGINRNFLYGVSTGTLSRESTEEAKSSTLYTSGIATLRVSTENGLIHAGDPISVSDLVPGIGAKALTSGMIVGHAITDMTISDKVIKTIEIESIQDSASNSEISADQALTEPTQAEATVSSKQKYEINEGTVKVLVNVMEYSPTGVNLTMPGASTTNSLSNLSAFSKDVQIDGDLTVNGAGIFKFATVMTDLNVGLIKISSGDNAINALGDTLKLQSAYGNKGVDFMDGKIVMTPEGNVKIAGELEAEKVSTHKVQMLGADENNPVSTVGEGIIPPYTLSVEIRNTQFNSTDKVFLTPTTPLGNQSLVIDKKEPGMFRVTLNNPYPTEIRFDYWIVGIK